MNNYRVIVSTDIGGSDPDDFQSMVHYLLYADRFDTEGLISSPWGAGRVRDILTVLDCYERDYPRLKAACPAYPAPDALRAVTAQGAVDIAPYRGFSAPTQGSDLIIRAARRDDPRPLYLLMWGLLEDLAQALHDAPDILPRLRVHYIGGPNKKWGPNAYAYLRENFPDLWMIENNATYRGWFNGGELHAYCTSDPNESLRALQGGTIILKGGSTTATVYGGSVQSAAISTPKDQLHLAGGRLEAINESGAAFAPSCGIQPGYVNDNYPEQAYVVYKQEEYGVEGTYLLTKGLDNGWDSWSGVELSPLAVTEITVKPESDTVKLDGSAAKTVALSGTVTAYALNDQGEPNGDPLTFTIDTSAPYADLWTIEEETSSSEITESGLTVGADERAAQLTVTLSLGNQTGTANITVEQPEVTVTYSDGGLSDVQGLPTKEENVKRYSTLDKAQEPTPTRAGYTLTGWQTEGGEPFEFGKTEVTENITLIPQWTAIAVDRVELAFDKSTLNERETATLTATIYPETALEQNVTWSFEVVTPAATSTSGIALTALTVPDDVQKILTAKEDPANTLTLTGVEAGEVKVTATAGGRSASCKITVQHVWGDPTFNWTQGSDGVWSATAERKCLGGLTQTGTATVVPRTTLEATCDTEGEVLYEVTGVDFGDGMIPPPTGTETKTQTISALGHKWSEPTWEWADDLTAATATFTCQNDPTHQSPVVATVTATVTQEADCEKPEITEYQAKAELDGKTYTDVRTKETAPALGHDWSEPTWRWSDDRTTATAAFTCPRDGFQQEVPATVTQTVLKAPTYAQEGLVEYKAQATGPDGTDYTTTFQAPLPKLTAPQSTLRPSLRPEDELYLDGRPPIPAHPTLRPGSVPAPTPAPMPLQTAAPAGPLPTVPATGDATDLRGDVALLACCAALLTALAVYLGKKRVRR